MFLSEFMEKIYQHQNVEGKWLKTWKQQNISSPRGNAKPYTIVVPPPNVTGTLHMGHGFQLTIMDILIRYHRMTGRKTLWQVGTDHAGIATQMVVERQLAQNGSNKHELGREAFVDKIWQWKQQSRDTIAQQMQAMGTSMDWSRERFTLDEEYTEKVAEVFIELYQAGLIYRGQKLVNWDPKLKTAVSDLEVINSEKQGNLWHIKYELADKPGEYIEIATTRPETLLGDQAIAVHPDDKRYQHLIGSMVKLPLTDRHIPIIADDYVDPEFGSGCVKITPAHDFNDAEIGKRHNLTALNIMAADASLNENVPKKYQGMDRMQARTEIIKDLNELVVKTESHTHIVPIGDRSGVIIEPMLTNQWFLNCDKMADAALAVVRDGDIEFVPEHWFNTYKHWLENIQDWCISRQLWWGHRIPAWYDTKNNIYVGQSESYVRSKYNLADDIELKQDADVLDTWFSSALWPFVTIGWRQEDLTYESAYPTDVLVTGFDIIFFWVARMIMMGLHFTNKIPFKQVYITGLIKDEKGQKMSKSKGNVLDPLDLVNGISLEQLIEKRTSSMMQPQLAASIEKQTKKAFPNGIEAFGTDALRFTFAALASNGRDIRFDINRLTGYRNFCNKLWNASRLVLSFNSISQDVSLYSEVDKWILQKLQVCVNQCHDHVKNYRFDLLAKALYEFTWHDFCDRYLEWAKLDRLRPNSQAEVVATETLATILKLLHPIMPFITEEIWSSLKATSDCLALMAYPEISKPMHYNSQEVLDLFAIINAVRNFRSELNIVPKAKLILTHESALNQDFLDKYQDNLAKLINCSFEDKLTNKASASIVANSIKFVIPIEDIVDPKVELIRIEQVIKKSEKVLAQANARLNNEKYCANAPKEQVEEYTALRANSELAIMTYKNHLELMQSLVDRSINE